MKCEKLICALDTTDENKAMETVERLSGLIKIFKVGKGLFVKAGPQIIRSIRNSGCEVFLDLKFHDIPHQISLALKSAVDHGVFMTSLHVSGGSKMLEAGVRAKGNSTILLLGITVLTSLKEGDLSFMATGLSINELVLRMAHMAHDSGLDGIVASPQEAKTVKSMLPENFLVVTPGIRPVHSEDDQLRIETPYNAINAGADYIVVGRPITAAADPEKAAEDIIMEIEKAVQPRK
jgi:orotidine-5'-phosphate decarboxylase